MGRTPVFGSWGKRLQGRTDGFGVFLLPALQRLEHFHQPAVIIGDCIGHQAFERHSLATVFSQQFRRDAGQLHPFQDNAFLDAEADLYPVFLVTVAQPYEREGFETRKT